MNIPFKLGLVTLAIMSTTIAFAQQVDNQDRPNEQSESAIEEIIITATRRETSLATTPQSISALSGKALERQGVDDFADFVGSIPGLTLRDQGPGQSRPVIRGLQGSGEGQVGVYYDDTPVTGGPGTTNDAGRFSPEIKPIDINRVEVLRGPQGTLYGGGSMGGTVRFIANKPDATKFEGNVSGEMISYSDGGTGYQASTVLNFPLIEDTLALRAVLYTRDHDGFVDNVTLGERDINDVESDGGRVAMRWTPNDDWTITGTWYFQDQELASGFHVNRDLGGFRTDQAAFDPFQDETDVYNLTVERSMDWADMLYSYSRFERDAIYRYWVPQSTLPPPNVAPPFAVAPSVNGGTLDISAGAVLQQPQPIDTNTHELRFTSNGDDAWQWTFGFYYQEREAYVESQAYTVTGAGAIDDTFGPFFLRYVDNYLEQTAVFGEVSYEFNDALTLTLGGRFFEIEGRNDAQQLRNFYYREANGPVLVTEGKEDDSVFKVHLGYNFTEDVVGYAQFSQGYRPGGPNQDVGGLASIPQSYEADSVDNYELGLRGIFMDGAMTAGLAVYHIKWLDVQTLQSDPTGLFRFVGNGGEAEINGVEFEITAAPLQGMTINAGFNYNDAELSTDSPFDARGGLSKTGLKGDSIPNTPDWSANLSVEYGWDLYGYSAFALASYQYTGESASDFNEFLVDVNTGAPSNNPNIEWDDRQGGYSIADVRVGLEGDDWSVSLFVDNVFDKRAIVQVFEDNLRPDPGFNFVAKPRTVGVSFSKDF